MTIRVVRLGSPRVVGEGLRVGPGRRPPRGGPRADSARRDYFDVWLPALAPRPDTLRLALHGDGDADWRRFERRYRREMAAPDAARLIVLLAALSHQSAFSVGCYCQDISRCHRRLLADLLAAAGGDVLMM